MDSSQWLVDCISACVSSTKKGILEIGLGYGENTQHFIEIAKEHNVLVYGIDPFESDWANMPESYGKPYSYSSFLNKIGEGIKHCVICKKSSLSYEAEHFVDLNKENIGVAYIDGLQYKNAVISDFNICKGIDTIIFDDYNRVTAISEVPIAIEHILRSNKYNVKVSPCKRYVILNAIK